VPVVEVRKSSGGRHRGAESAETSTPCIKWGSTTAVGESLPFPGNSSTDECYNYTVITGPHIHSINVKNCSLYTLLTATDLKPQKS